MTTCFGIISQHSHANDQKVATDPGFEGGAQAVIALPPAELKIKKSAKA
jgi:hypothetical protein